MTFLHRHRFLASLVALCSLPVLAHAHPGHPGHDFAWGFTGGVTHPLFGLDHLLAMIGVGLWAGQQGGKARWLVPSSFVGMMLLGAVLAHRGLLIPGTEQVIAASLLVVGLMIASARRMAPSLGMALIGFFGMFHGMAHGAEIPAQSSGLLYGAGFILATIGLHALGLALGQLNIFQSTRLRQSTGALVAFAGAALMLV